MLGAEALADERTYTIAVPGDTWGARVIDAEAFIEANHQGDPDALQELDNALYDARLNLTNLSRKQKAQFGRYIRGLIGERFPAAPRNDRKLTEYVAELENSSLVEVLKLHYAVVLEEQADAMPMFLGGKESFIAQTEKGIDDGWISEDARSVRDRMGEIRFRVGDIGLTHLQKRGGIAMPYANQIMVSQGLGSTREERTADLKRNFDLAFDHEGNHVAFDGKFGGEPYFLFAWFIEGMAEHVRLGKEVGQPDVLAPSTRDKDTRIYIGFRNFIDFLARQAPGGRIDAKYFTRAYTSSGFNSEDWMSLEEQLDTKWGSLGFLFRVGRAFKQNCDLVLQQHKDWDSVRVWESATAMTRRALDKDPVSILGPSWQKPPRAIGRAAVIAS